MAFKQDTKELIKMLAEKKEALRNFRFNIAGGKIRNTKEGRDLRKEIARILTELRQREINVKK